MAAQNVEPHHTKTSNDLVNNGEVVPMLHPIHPLQSEVLGLSHSSLPACYAASFSYLHRRSAPVAAYAW